MDFKPFDVPPSDYHPLATGLGDEGGVTPRNLVAGINTYLAHLFAAIEGKVPKLIKSGEADLSALRRGPGVMVISAEDDIGHLSDRIAKLEQDVAMLEDLLTSAQRTPQEPTLADAIATHMDDNNSEIGIGTYTSSGTTLTLTRTNPVGSPMLSPSQGDPPDEPDSPQPPNSLAALLAATGGGKAG